MKAIMKFDHIGVFVKSLSVGRKYLTEMVQIKSWSDPINDEIQGVSVQFGYDESGICYELVAPNGKINPVDNLLGQGKNIINHVGYKVNNLENEILRLQNLNCILVSGPTPAIAFNNKKIAFLYTPLKFIIELIEN